MNKFVQTLSAENKDIKVTRATNLSNKVKTELTDLINDLTKVKTNLETDLLNLTDLAPDNSYSLKPGGENFDAKEWVRKVHGIKVELKMNKVELDTANEIKEEWFAEVKDEN